MMTDAPARHTPIRDRRPVISIDEQIDEIGRQLRRLEKFPGRLKPETRERKAAALSAAERSLRTIKDHADGLRVLITYLRSHREHRVDWEDVSPAMADVLLSNPAVRFVTDEFPEAVLVASRPLSALDRSMMTQAATTQTDTEDDDSDTAD